MTRSRRIAIIPILERRKVAVTIVLSVLRNICCCLRPHSCLATISWRGALRPSTELLQFHYICRSSPTNGDPLDRCWFSGGLPHAENVLLKERTETYQQKVVFLLALPLHDACQLQIGVGPEQTHPAMFEQPIFGEL
jgi:hypothetical protein